MQAKSKSKSKNNLSKVYTEFSRQQFNKYKLKFPKLKESEITKKVWREWEEMDEATKQGLLETYQKKGLIAQGPVKPAKKPDTKDEKEQSKQKGKKKDKEVSPSKPAPPAPAVPKTLPLSISRESVIAQAASQAEESSDATPEILKQKKQGSESGREGSIGSSEDASKKKVQRRNYGEYINFFRFYFQRLTKEHPKWSPNQKTVIIRLLWKKRQLQKKKESKKSKKGHRLGARARIARQYEHTQYTYFVQQRIEAHPDVEPSIIRRGSLSVWKKLHRAGKDYYRKMAAEYNRENPVVKREKKSKKEVSPVSFLNNVI